MLDQSPSQVQMDLDLQSHNLNQWAAASVFLFDILITMDQEISYVWQSAWTLPKAIYFMSRYYGVAFIWFDAIVALSSRNAKFCQVYDPLQYTCVMILAGLADALLVLRVRALFHANSRVCKSLLALYFLAYTVVLALLCYYFSRVAGGTYQFINVGCTSADASTVSATLVDARLLATMTSPILVLNAVMFILTLSKILPIWNPAAPEQTPLLTLFVRDGSWYFAVIFSTVALLTITTSTLVYRPGLVYIALPWFIVISPIMSNRLFLNLRATKRQSHTTIESEADTSEQNSSRTATSAPTPSPLISNYTSTSPATPHRAADCETGLRVPPVSMPRVQFSTAEEGKGSAMPVPQRPSQTRSYASWFSLPGVNYAMNNDLF